MWVAPRENDAQTETLSGEEFSKQRESECKNPKVQLHTTNTAQLAEEQRWGRGERVLLEWGREGKGVTPLVPGHLGNARLYPGAARSFTGCV